MIISDKVMHGGENSVVSFKPRPLHCWHPLDRRLKSDIYGHQPRRSFRLSSAGRIWAGQCYSVNHTTVCTMLPC